MTRTLPNVAPGQKWSLRDDNYDGWRYLTVTRLDDRYVYATGNTKRRHTRILRTRFAKGRRWSFCGNEGPGILPPYSEAGSVTLGCLSHGHHATVLPLAYDLGMNYGFTEVTRDGDRVWAQVCDNGDEGPVPLSRFDAEAVATSGDWRVRIESPSSERLYQRQDTGWVLVAIGHGFA